MRLLILALLASTAFVGCDNSKEASGANDKKVDKVAEAPRDVCGNVRLTSYGAKNGGWCEYNRNAPMLPESVRQGLTLAIAEPWNGSSYGGDKGEACGECWEIASIDATRIVMVHDLCPIEGNPVCNGSQFHFDVSTETAEALNLKGLDAATARRVPCPVTGNAYLQIIDRNEWGYLRFQVINHRLPVRLVEYRAKSSSEYHPAERSGGAWAVDEHGDMFSSASEGGAFRITSAAGDVVEMPNYLTYDVKKGDYFDLGAQVGKEASDPSASCKFLPPDDVYVDGYGGIESVKWMMNPWANAKPSEVTSDCLSGRCLRIDGMRSGSGFHIYYRQSFAPTTFKTLEFSARAVEGQGTFQVTLTGENTECDSTEVQVSDKWAKTAIDLAKACSGRGPVNSVTVYGSSTFALLLDELRFVP